MRRNHVVMRRPAGLVALVLAGFAAGPVLAGNATPPAPQPTAEGRSDPLCSGFGKDFVRLSSTQTCVKLSGNVQVDGYQQALPVSPGDALAPALKSR